MCRHKSRQLKIFCGLGLAVLLIMSGCQSLQPTQQGELTLQDSEFMSLWDKYNECTIESDPLQMQAYVQELTEAPRPISIQHSPIPLPKFLVKLTSRRGSRLSVDPRAMAVSCALQTGQVAWEMGNYPLAEDMLQLIIDEYPEPEYSYYVAEARTALKYVPSIRNASYSK